jgi:hypothetical protein
MNASFWRIVVLGIVACVVVACAPPVGANEPHSASVDEISTIVAATLQALSPQAVEEATEIQETRNPDVLPHSLYFLGKDSNWVDQLFRMERDGQTKVQLTSEPAGIDDYDVSPVDGSVAYITNNQLNLIEPDGSNRRELVLGGPKEGNTPWVANPVFSPDGKTLAYSHDGLYFLELETLTGDLILRNQYGDTSPEGVRFPLEIYWPEQFSPDGTKLLVAMGHWEVAPSHAVYDLETKALVRSEGVPDGAYCCSFHGGPAWSTDGASYVGIASIHDSAYQYGELWKVDTASGRVTRMFTSPFEGSETVYLPVEPFAAPDGQVYFFFGTYDVNSGYFDAPILQLVRAKPGEASEPTILRPENFRLMEEALWAPDASLVVVASAPERRWDQGGGVLEMYPMDRQKEPIWLAPLGSQLKWGP